MERWPVLPVGASDRHRMERRSPTGIARERETRPNDPTPHANPTWSAGLRPASLERRSPTGIARERETRPNDPTPHANPTWSAGQFSRWGPPTGIARERETRTDDGAPYRREWRTPCSIRTAPLAPLRGAVPTGGRRSLAGVPSLPGGVRAETGVIRELGDTRFRDPAGVYGRAFRMGLKSSKQ